MPVHAIVPDYQGEVLDKQSNFHGNQVVYVAWDAHLMFCAAFAYPVPPTMLFKTLVEDVISDSFSPHPEFAQINWATAEWLLDGEPFIPQWDVALHAQNIGHKSLLRFITPELKGFQQAAV